MPAERASPPPGRSPGADLKARALTAMGLDVVYVRGRGSALYCPGEDEPVWDFVGGYGACLTGHNHPDLTDIIRAFLDGGGVMHGQASVRQSADLVREALSTRLTKSLGGQFDVLLANTGSEAVELAARHAEVIYGRKRAAAASWAGAACPQGPLTWSARARDRMTLPGVRVAPRTWEELDAHNREVLGEPPLHLVLRRSYHGNTARALELTWDPQERYGPRLFASPVRFVDASDPGALELLLGELTRPLLKAVPDGDAWEVETLSWTPVVAFFLEPMQGEGGIHPLSGASARRWQEEANRYGVPIVADEIQCGMGRTGTFLYCEQIGLRPDYVLLGKSLGGALVKISAVAVTADRRLDDFSLHHTSTFAEDELSSRVALGTLELLDREDVAARVRERGAWLRSALDRLVKRHPDVLHEVRGSGLMLGLEWKRTPFSRSAALRFLQQYDWLGYALSGYLLRGWGVRVTPALSDGFTMRLEPAFDVPDEACDRLLSGLDALCTLIAAEDCGGLVSPALGTPPAASLPRRSPPMVLRAVQGVHVGFIGHFIDAAGVAHWDPSFARLGVDACRTFLERVRPFAEPLLCHRDQLRSRTGEVTTLSFIGIPVTSEQCYDGLRGTARHELRELVQRAVDHAAEQGCGVVGLGGYASILTRNGRALNANGMALTTGNGYTVGAALHAIRAAAEGQGIRLADARVAVVGATGNIGGVLAALLAGEAGALTLIGRVGREHEIAAEAARVLNTVLHSAPDAPLLRALRTAGFPVRPSSSEAELAGICTEVFARLGEASPVVLGSDLALCREASIIAAASNHPQAILFPEHIAFDRTVVADLAVPGDVHPSVRAERPLAIVLRGGVVRTPLDRKWRIPAIPLPRGEMFACMAETVLMGFENDRRHGSLGRLTPDRVRHTLALARKHGFDDVRTAVDAPTDQRVIVLA